jgi:hypothetical protein
MGLRQLAQSKTVACAAGDPTSVSAAWPTITETMRASILTFVNAVGTIEEEKPPTERWGGNNACGRGWIDDDRVCVPMWQDD